MLTRRANRLRRHPLLGHRIWTRPYAVWKNFLSLSKPELLYLKDHRINGVVLFPAAGFLEMFLAAANQLTSSSVMTIIGFEQVHFLKALKIEENQSIELHTIILQPLNEFYIYSRRSLQDDYVRADGIASNDILVAYSDKNVLEEYKDSEWTLHVRGLLIRNPEQAMEPIFHHDYDRKYQLLRQNASWTLDESVGTKQLYDFLEYRGYQYGSCFQPLRLVCGSKAEVSAKIIFNEVYNGYHFHPILTDGCLQTSLILLPTHHTYVPTYINKIIFVANSFQNSERTDFGVYVSHRPVTRGVVATDESFTTDICLLGGENRDTCIVGVDGLKLQSITGSLDLVMRNHSLFDRLKKSAWLPNIEQNQAELKTIFDAYCFEPVWTRRSWMNERRAASIAVATLEDLFAAQLVAEDGSLHRAKDLINQGCNQTDTAAMNSSELSAQWISDIAKYAFLNITGAKEIDRAKVQNAVDTKYRPLTDVL